jgi:rubrerythrin
MGTPLPPTGRPAQTATSGDRTSARISGDLRCMTCGYGVVMGLEPAPRCPMCGGTTWEWVGTGRPRPAD